jgi:plastocyanin
MRPRTVLKPRMLVLFAFAALIGAAVAVLPALAAAPSEAKLEVNENCEVSTWSCWTTEGSASIAKPTKSVTIASGGTVTFIDHASTAAAVVWMGSAPACTGVPTSAMAGWEGKCKFEQPGTYKFESSTLWPEYTKYEIVVEGATTDTTPTTTPTTTTPTTTTTTSPTTPSEPGHGSPLEGGSRALELAGSQRGSTVHGSIKVSQAGSGGRLEVGLFAAEASLAKAGRSKQVRVGRLVRSSVKAGSVSFSVPLNARGRAALRRHRRLALTVKITLTPLHGAAVTLTRGVVSVFKR